VLYRVTGSAVLVRTCIACGAIDSGHTCLGTCREHRLELVAADEHAAAGARLEALDGQLRERRALAEQLARGAPSGDEWEALRVRARAALRVLAAPAPGAVVATWACDSCGRVEAPQECLGVCVRPVTPMVPASEHAGLLARAEATQQELERLAPLVRQLAWTRTKVGRENDAARALHALAGDLAGACR
jgi:hypothetical protein